MVNNTINQINHYPADKCYQNQLSYPADGAIHPSNSWGLVLVTNVNLSVTFSLMQMLLSNLHLTK